MPIEFSDNWLSAGADHLKTKDLARRLIASAAAKLADSKSMEIVTWAGAATSGEINQGAQGNFLRVYKDLHQEEGVFKDLVHLTMSLKIKQKSGGEREHSLYGGAFHLYVKVLDPVVGKKKRELQPVKLSYKAMGGDIKSEDIAGAAALDSEA